MDMMPSVILSGVVVITIATGLLLGELRRIYQSRQFDSKLRALQAQNRVLQHCNTKEELAQATQLVVDVLKNEDCEIIKIGNVLLIKHQDESCVSVDSITLSEQQMGYFKGLSKLQKLAKLRAYALEGKGISLYQLLNPVDNTLLSPYGCNV